MQTEPITLEAVEGPIVVTVPTWWGKPQVTVAGVPAPRTGGREYALPGKDGNPVKAIVRASFIDPYPTLEIDGTRHQTGPKVPVVLQILAVLPFILVPLGGALGGVIAALAIIANVALMRVRVPAFAKALLMIAMTGVAFLVWAWLVPLVLDALT